MIERIKERAHLIRPMLVPLIFYIGALAFSINWIEKYPESPWNLLIAILPVIPGIIIAIFIVRAILQLDELQRKILLEGTAVSFGATFILLLTLGLLGVAGFPPINGSYIALFMALTWLIGKLWATRRYG